ncbi:hypothetical protein F5882DRAFT_524453 [Hyaloscypha sp. PMI_1271]|nr:hypothetical protein F5882DRAFT_524453 [Hyaloscypha sp. PMI_1271]
MRSSITVNNAVILASGFSALVSASGPLATVYPCPSCPSSVAPTAITVTAQYQTVSTCTPYTTTVPNSVYGSALNKVEASCSAYPWVSTVIPCAGGSSTTVTKTEQAVKIGYSSTVLTSEYPCATTAPSYNGTGYGYSNSSCTSTKLTTMVVDVTCPYKDLGPLAIPGYPGSGLCTTCAEDKNGTKSQVVNVVKCMDKSCSTYPETWVSAKPTTPTSVSSAVYSSSTFCPTSGVYTIPVTTTCTPSGPDFTKPVTKTFSIITSVSDPQTIQITKTITITYSGKPAPTAYSSSSQMPVSTSTYCTKNGPHTIPIVATITPANPIYTPVTSTVYYTTTVTNAPVHIGCTKSLTVTFTSTACPSTVVSGTTKSPTGYPTAPAVTTSASSSYPTVPASCEYSGCYGSPSGFSDFTLVETSGYMSVSLCTSECIASGYPYSGLYKDTCYCAKSLDSCTESGGVCDISCPGASSQHCGGDVITGAKKLQSKLFDVYECTVPTSTSTSTTDTASYTVDPTPDPSSDPDYEPAYEPAKRNIQADMEVSQNTARDAKLRRGGMLRSTEKRDLKNVMVKRDFGLKRPFGM